MILTVILTALLLDYWLGEPRHYHPLVGFGQLASYTERRLNNSSGSMLSGGIAVFLLLTPFCLVTRFVHNSLSTAGLLSWLFEALVLYWAVGHQNLKQHVTAVVSALEAHDTERARTALSYIVSRETDELDHDQISRAAIETTLENGNDAIFAAIFWYACAGPVAVVIYRLSNTLDAMWGYRNTRYESFGKAAAKLDDLFNYIPARLVACTYALLGNASLAFECWKNQARLLASPNAGPVMSAGAGALDLRLGGPCSYHGQLQEKPFFGGKTTPKTSDINRSLRLIDGALLVWCLCLATGMLIW